jgi:hypothetical protein
MKKIYYLILPFVLILSTCEKEGEGPNDDGLNDNGLNPEDIVNIPDVEFWSALIAEGVDTDGDRKISKAEAEAVISLNVSGRDISDMTGIEAFVNLDTLRCNFVGITSLDVSGCTALTYLDCSGWNWWFNNSNYVLTTLDLSNNTALTFLDCGASGLTSLDVSHNKALRYLNCGDNQLTSLDISNNTALAHLDCSGTNLTSLDVSHNTALTYLDCGGNQLTSLDVSHNKALTYLNCDDNQLTSLDVSNNTALTHLACGNLLTSLDVSNNTNLEGLDLDGNHMLEQVCVWESFPAGVMVEVDGSPNVYFTSECDTKAPKMLHIRFGSTGDPLNGLTITWQNEGMSDSIAWGFTSSLEEGIFKAFKRLNAFGKTVYDYTFPALQTEKTIHYALFDSKDNLWTLPREYKTASDASDNSFSFTAFGDSRSYPMEWLKIAEATLETDFTLFLGDIVASGGNEADWTDWFKYGEKFVTRELIYHCIGNHDEDGSVSGFDTYTDMFTLPGNERYYSFTYGNAVFICLNSEDPENTGQNSWLHSTLEANKYMTWKFVFFHKPFYTSPHHTGDMDEYFDTWWKEFDDYGVDMIFNGHTHNYQRTKPINRKISTIYPVATYGSGEGMGRCQIVSGAAGAPLYGEAEPGLWWLAKTESKLHFCNIDIDGDVLTFKAIDVNQVVFDELVIDKRE